MQIKANKYNPYNDVEPDVLEEVVVWALRQLPNKKAQGINRIPSDAESSADPSIYYTVPSHLERL